LGRRLRTVVTVLLLTGCAACTSAQDSQHARSIPDNKTGEQLLLNASGKWFTENTGNLQQNSSVSSKAVAGSQTFHVASSTLQAGQSGQVDIEITRPTITKSTPDCSAPYLRQCTVSQVSGYTVMSTAGSSNDVDVHQFSVEVYDSDGNLLGLTIDKAVTTQQSQKLGPPPLGRNQAIDLSIACVNAFA
jgi:hypothetical protein